MRIDHPVLDEHGHLGDEPRLRGVLAMNDALD
jgi:hypothetical protein